MAADNDSITIRALLDIVSENSAASTQQTAALETLTGVISSHDQEFKKVHSKLENIDRFLRVGMFRWMAGLIAVLFGLGTMITWFKLMEPMVDSQHQLLKRVQEIERNQNGRLGQYWPQQTGRPSARSNSPK